MRIDITMGHTEPLPVLRTLIISDNIAKGIFTMVSKRKPYKTLTKECKFEVIRLMKVYG